MKKKNVVLIGLFLVGFIIILFVVSKNKTIGIDLDEFVKVEVNGYNTRGHAELIFNEDAFLEKYGSEIKIKEMDSRITALREKYGNSVQPAYLLLQCISYQLDKTTELSNGDDVTVIWNYDDEILKKEFGCELKHADKVYPVSDLQEIVEYNPFDDVEITYYGDTFPDIFVEICDSSSPIAELYYDFEKTYGFGKGEKVRLNVKPDNIEEISMDKYGLKLTALYKDYDLPQDMPEYICDFSQMSTEEIEEIITLYADIIRMETSAEGYDPKNVDPNSPIVEVTPYFQEALITESHNMYLGFVVYYDFSFCGKYYSKNKYVYVKIDSCIRNISGDIEFNNFNFLGSDSSNIYSNTAWAYLGPGAPTYTIRIDGDYGVYDEYNMYSHISDSVISTYYWGM